MVDFPQAETPITTIRRGNRARVSLDSAAAVSGVDKISDMINKAVLR
jgi:hypothetical protein